MRISTQWIPVVVLMMSSVAGADSLANKLCDATGLKSSYKDVGRDGDCRDLVKTKITCQGIGTYYVCLTQGQTQGYRMGGDLHKGVDKPKETAPTTGIKGDVQAKSSRLDCALPPFLKTGAYCPDKSMPRLAKCPVAGKPTPKFVCGSAEKLDTSNAKQAYQRCLALLNDQRVAITGVVMADAKGGLYALNYEGELLFYPCKSTHACKGERVEGNRDAERAIIDLTRSTLSSKPGKTIQELRARRERVEACGTFLHRVGSQADSSVVDAYTSALKSIDAELAAQGAGDSGKGPESSTQKAH